MIDLAEIIIDRSQSQHDARLNAMRLELLSMGYSIIQTSSLYVLKENSNAETKPPHSHQSQASRASISQARV
jgi:hypothetical protein